MDNKTTTKRATKIREQQTETYMQLFLYQAPKRNNVAIVKKNLKQFISWFNERRGTVEYYQQLDKSEFFGLVTQGKKHITGGFSHLKE
jgi:hypothetical protein